MTTIKNTTPLESWEAEQFHKWLVTQGIPHTHVPNETGHSKEAKLRALKMKRQGTSAGVYDYEVYVPVPDVDGEIVEYELVKLELKRVKGGTTSEAQRKWSKIYEMAGIQHFVCRGWEEARAAIQAVMANNRWDTVVEGKKPTDRRPEDIY